MSTAAGWRSTTPSPRPDLHRRRHTMADDTEITMTGGCLCGAVRYEARLEKPEGYYCHCRMCQLAFGNVRAALVNVRKDQVAWTAGTPTRHPSSKIALRGFCGRCGTPLTFEY